MTSRPAKAFDGELQKLFRRRTDWMRREVSDAPERGRPPKFRKKDVSAAINSLMASIEACLLKGKAIDSMKDLYDHKKQWRNKGWGTDARRKLFLNWFDENVSYSNCVYVFWAGKECRYVGRTFNGGSRPQNHFRKKWFKGITRIVVMSSQGARNTPKLECLATHRYKPKYSKIKPSKKKWHAQCQICKVQTKVRKDVKVLFRLR